MQGAVENWRERARYDIETAKAMLDSGRYLYVFFCCQQSIEKMLKALIAKETEELPPRLHNLVRLAGKTSLSLTDEREAFFHELTSYYVPTRYPEEFAKLGRNLTSETAEQIYTATQEAIEWLSGML